MAWVVLALSAMAVLAVGLTATAIVLSSLGASLGTPAPAFWLTLAGACVLTVASLGLRSLRWIFLLRRAETRIPIRDAYIGYLAGFSLLLAPLFLGEIVVRAWVLRRRGGVPTGVTAVLSMWERWFDLLALASIAGVLWALSGQPVLAWGSLGITGLFLVLRAPRALLLGLLTSLVNRAGRLGGSRVVPPLPRLVKTRTCWTTFATSVAAWLLPALGFYVLCADAALAVHPLDALLAYAASTLRAGLAFVPGGEVGRAHV
mgnify:CR=1 FL=1